ncbi:MAG TPA: serine/threonine-protein kinase [Gemmatimonadales bacterium]|nr:serine/threonine-protein kinase [Gemmatimonadales bacterium]
MPLVSLCDSCGAPHPDPAVPCARCGWAPRRVRDQDPAPAWSEEDETADRIEAALGGEYEIEGLIGRGGMATVYLAREVALDRPVAIKVLAPHLLRSPGMAERFKREARLAAALSHRNVIPIYAVKEQGSLICLVMKRLTGRSLDQVLGMHGPLPVEVAQLVLHDVAAGLEFAHQRGVVHRDIKPANILVDVDGEIVVTDFGIAKAREVDALTASGATIGTPAYMSPEQAMGKRATPASDQYSLGTVAYELITGKMPFTAETAMGLMYQHTHTPPTPIRSVRPDVPPEVAEAVERMLSKDPAARFPSLPEASRALGVPSTIGTMDDPVRRDLARRVTPIAPAKRRSGNRGARTSSTGARSSNPSADPEAPTLIVTPRWTRRILLGFAAVVIGLGGFLAAGLWRATPPALPAPPADSAPTRPADSTPAPVTTPATPPAAAAARKRPDPVTVREAIETYRRAVESRDIQRVIEAFPAIEPDQLERYRQLFRQSTGLRFIVAVKEIKVDGREARVQVEGAMRYHDTRTNKDVLSNYSSRARLAEGPLGWRILEIR